jgi:hypothetical protein
VSNVYGTSIGNHAKLHLPKPLEKIVQPLERAGEKIKEATKDEFEAKERPKKEAEMKKQSDEETPDK